MSNLEKDLKSTTTPIDLDGFDGHTDERIYEGGEDRDQHVNPRLIEGDRISFSKAGVWIDASTKKPLPDDLLLIVTDMKRVVQKWTKDNLPALDTPPIILGPNEPWPDVDAMNAKCPKPEWRKYFDKDVGPYQKQKILYFWDLSVSMKKYTWATSTDSGMAGVSDLVEKIQMMRQFKKVKAIPVVKLSSRLWSRRYGTMGPDFIVERWIVKDEGGGLLLPASDPTSPKLSGAEEKPSTIKETSDAEFAGMKTVNKPTGKEATGDEIIF